MMASLYGAAHISIQLSQISDEKAALRAEISQLATYLDNEKKDRETESKSLREELSKVAAELYAERKVISEKAH